MGCRCRVGWREWVAILLLITASGCSLSDSTEDARTIQIQQAWQLQVGDTVADHRIVAGLGDVSIQLGGDKAYAPFDGRIQPNTEECVLFSSPDVPAYLFRLCGLANPHLGEIRQGSTIGSGSYLHFATLRKQPDGTWAMVEPARDILERILKPP